MNDLISVIPSWNNIAERFKRGDVCDLVVDTETSDLSKYFAHPASLGVVISDPLTRQILHIHERQVAFAEKLATFDVVAGLVTERSPDTFENGMRPDLAVAELYDLIRRAPTYIAQFYETFPARITEYNHAAETQVPLPPVGDDAVIQYQYVTNRRTKADRAARIKSPKNTRTEKNPVFIPSRDEAGNIVYRAAISRDGKSVYWYENDRWQRVDAKKTVIMHNQRADNSWIWEWCHRYLLPDQFITHTKKYRAYMIDTIPLAREVSILGPQGRNSLKLGARVDAELGRVPSTSLDMLMQANSRIENIRINLNQGVRIAGGAKADPRLGHVSPAYDALKTLGLYWYCEDIAPAMVKFKKYISDHDVIADVLMDPMPSGAPAPFAFIRSRYPHLDVHAGLIINIDKSYGDFKKAIVIALDLLKTDPTDMGAILLPDGRDIFMLSQDDWIDLLKKTYTDRISPLEIIGLNKSAMVQPLQSAYASGRLKRVTPEEINMLAHKLYSDRALCDRIMQAYAVTRSQQDASKKIADPRPEEYVFSGLGDPPRITIHRQDLLEKEEMERAIYERARSKIDFYHKRNHYLRILLRPYPDIEGDNPDPLAYREYERHFHKTLRKYERLVRGSVLSHKTRTDIPHINVPKYKSVRFKSNEQVLRFLWALRKKALKKNWLVDVSADHYRIIEESTQREISLTRLSQIDIQHFRTRMDPILGDWDICFERLNHQAHFLATLFILAGRKQTLLDIDPSWEDWYKAQRTFGFHGTPNVPADNQRMPTHERNLQIIKRIKNGTLSIKDDLKSLSYDTDHAASIRDRLIAGLPGREQILEAFERYSEKGCQKNRWTKELLEYAGYDGRSALRLENIAYPMLRKVFEAATRFEMPEAVPYNPLRSDLEGEMIYPIPYDGKMKDAWETGKLSGLSNLIFRTPKMGRTYLVPKAQVKLETLRPNSSDYLEVRKIFHDSGLFDYPLNQKPVFMVNAEGCFPVAGVRVVDPFFALPVIGPHRFKAILAPQHAGFQGLDGTYRKLTGLAMPDYGYTHERGYKLAKDEKIRLRETNVSGEETGWEICARLKDVRYMTLKEFEVMYAQKYVDFEFAHSYGFTSPAHMYTEICQWFTDFDKPKDAPENRILLIRFQKVKKWEGTEYFNPASVPRAAITDTYSRSMALRKNN